MSYSFLFEILKSSDEKISKAIKFNDGTSAPSISSATIKAYDSSNADVSSTIIDSSGSVTSGDTQYFRVKAGTAGQTYLLKVTATMTSGDVMDATGQLIINDPS